MYLRLWLRSGKGNAASLHWYPGKRKPVLSSERYGTVRANRGYRKAYSLHQQSRGEGGSVHLDKFKHLTVSEHIIIIVVVVVVVVVIIIIIIIIIIIRSRPLEEG